MKDMKSGVEDVGGPTAGGRRRLELRGGTMRHRHAAVKRVGRMNFCSCGASQDLIGVYEGAWYTPLERKRQAAERERQRRNASAAEKAREAAEKAREAQRERERQWTLWRRSGVPKRATTAERSAFEAWCVERDRLRAEAAQRAAQEEAERQARAVERARVAQERAEKRAALEAERADRALLKPFKPGPWEVTTEKTTTPDGFALTVQRDFLSRAGWSWKVFRDGQLCGEGQEGNRLRARAEAIRFVEDCQRLALAARSPPQRQTLDEEPNGQCTTAREFAVELKAEQGVKDALLEVR